LPWNRPEKGTQMLIAVDLTLLTVFVLCSTALLNRKKLH
jgi:hypothetical protein